MGKLIVALVIWLVALLILGMSLMSAYPAHAGVILPEMAHELDWWLEAMILSVLMAVCLVIADRSWRYLVLGVLYLAKFTLLPVALMVAWVTKFLCWSLCGLVTRVEGWIVVVRYRQGKEAAGNGI